MNDTMVYLSQFDASHLFVLLAFAVCLLVCGARLGSRGRRSLAYLLLSPVYIVVVVGGYLASGVRQVVGDMVSECIDDD